MKGHSADFWNDRADLLANKGAAGQTCTSGRYATMSSDHASSLPNASSNNDSTTNGLANDRVDKTDNILSDAKSSRDMIKNDNESEEETSSKRVDASLVSRKRMLTEFGKSDRKKGPTSSGF